MQRTIPLPYGRKTVELSLDTGRFEIALLLPRDPPPLPDARAEFLRRAGRPTGTRPLHEIARGKGGKGTRVTIVTADHTRPVPDHLLVPWVVEALGVEDRCVTVLVGTGTHRASTPEELERMLGAPCLDRFRVLCHDCTRSEDLVHVGTSRCGTPCWLHRAYVESDIRVATGFVEPHFFAGFSGGTKAVVPGISGLETILCFHRAELIGHPGTTLGNTRDNPLLDLTRELVSLCPPDLIVNVSLNHAKQIAGIFVGDCVKAHEEACRSVGADASTPPCSPFPVVVTTNSGYPLDMNYYQTVKGMTAAAHLVETGGDILVASECSQGIPAGSAFERILSEPLASEPMLQRILERDETLYDQWEVQALLQVLRRARVHLYSSMNPGAEATTRVFHISSLEETLEACRTSRGAARLPVAVLPLGPLTIPVLRRSP